MSPSEERTFCHPVSQSYARIHTTLEISLLLQTKVTKNCYHQMRFLGCNATEMRWGPWLCPDTAGELTEGKKEREGDKEGRKGEVLRKGEEGREKEGECNVAQ